jgi:hypothetical protein
VTSYAIEHRLTLGTVTCCACGMVFAMPESLIARRKSDGKSFYCPSGHVQAFVQSEAQRLRALLDQANRRNTELAAECTRVTREKQRIEQRIAAGVCPCCNRTFQNLARHIASKHKEFAA